MGIFSVFSKDSKTNNFPLTQIEQRSHGSINLPTKNESVSRTLDQLSQEDLVNIKTVDTAESRQHLKSVLRLFTSQYPDNMFVIDGEKNSTQSIICTDSPQGKTCLNLQVDLIELFKTMQNSNYFCSLADDIDSSYFECRRIRD